MDSKGGHSLGEDAAAALRRSGSLVGIRADARHPVPLSGRDYRAADLSAADFAGWGHFRHYDFRGTIFHLATLDRTWWLWTDLRAADLTSASLRGAHFAACDLRDADLSFTDLMYVRFDVAQGPRGFVGCDLRGARLVEADLRHIRFSTRTAWPDGFDPSEAGALPVE